MLRTIAWATLVAGTLDILMASIDVSLSGGSVPSMFPSSASGPFGDGMRQSSLGVPAGLLVHFAIMAVIAAVYVVAARRMPVLNRYWWIAGLVYGFGVWLVMYGAVLPMRFGSSLPTEPIAVAKGLFAHFVLVGLPIAWITARARRT